MVKGRMLKAEEVATFLKVSKMTVYRYVELGHLSGVRVNGILRIPEESLASFLSHYATIPPGEERVFKKRDIKERIAQVIQEYFSQQ